MSLRKRGHLPDHPHAVARRAGLHLHPASAEISALMSGQNLPLRTTNRANLSLEKGGPGVIDQTNVGGCEGCSHASAGTLRLANLGVSRGLLSPSALYLGALLVDQTTDRSGKLSPVTDTGTMPSSVITAWSSFGAMLAKDDPQYPMNSKVIYQDPSDENSLLILPKLDGSLYADASYRYGGAYFVKSTGTQRLLEALAVFASGRTLTDSIPASEDDFQGYSGGVLGRLAGPIDHSNHVADYEWTGSAADFASFVAALQQGDTATVARLAPSLVFHCVNSWGEEWGEGDETAGTSGGLYRANTDYFDQAEDLCVVDIQPAS